ncbi:hypothetical protein ABIA48_001984 [Pseudomonas sp. S30_BP2TU TE3576]
MRSINPFEIWLFPQRNSQSRNTLPHCLSTLGGGQ